MRRCLAILFCLTGAISASAQESRLFDRVPPTLLSRADASASEEGERREPLETDRDSFTPATKTVDRGRTILESAYSFLDNRRSFETHSFPELILRHGLTERVELRLGWNYEVGGSGSSVSGPQGLEGLEGAGVERESHLLYGLKVMVTDQKVWVPQSCFLIQGSTPTSGKETDTQVNLGYVFGWKLPNRWKLDAAMRYGTATAGDDHFIIWAPSTVLRIPLGERWAVHGEYFGEFSQQFETNFVKHYASPGVHYLVTENLEVGVRVGWGLNDQASRFFANVGFGWRF